MNADKHAHPLFLARPRRRPLLAGLLTAAFLFAYVPPALAEEPAEPAAEAPDENAAAQAEEAHRAALEWIEQVGGSMYGNTVNLNNLEIADITPLAGLTSLEILNLSSTQVADLSPLAGLENLQWLKLERTPVSDLSPLAGLENLQLLTLHSCEQLTDFTPLHGLKNLHLLVISDTQFSPEDLEALERALPECFIGSELDLRVYALWSNETRGR